MLPLETTFCYWFLAPRKDWILSILGLPPFPFVYKICKVVFDNIPLRIKAFVFKTLPVSNCLHPVLKFWVLTEPFLFYFHLDGFFFPNHIKKQM